MSSTAHTAKTKAEATKCKEATEAMAERQQALAAAEEEWLALADRA